MKPKLKLLGEGGLNGLYTESLVLNGMQATLEENMKHYDEWGGPNTYPTRVRTSEFPPPMRPTF